MSMDQYGMAVPADLVTPPDLVLLSYKEIELIDNLDWYECEGIILIPDNEVGGDDPRDSGLTVDEDGNVVGEIFKIDQVLHRYGVEDGWYHA